jgi:hypothetical protein
MGACTFGDVTLVRGDAREAYNTLCEEYAYENGHRQGYSGDIQTTSGFRDLTSIAPKYNTKAFWAWEEDCIDNDKYVEKWGNAGCIEIKGTALKKMKERSGLKGKKGYRAFYFFGWAAE